MYKYFEINTITYEYISPSIGNFKWTLSNRQMWP